MAWVGARGADRVPGPQTVREIYLSGGADRNRQDAPDPRAPGEHRASGSGGPGVWGAACRTAVPACLADRVRESGDREAGRGGGSAAGRAGKLARRAIILGGHEAPYSHTGLRRAVVRAEFQAAASGDGAFG